MEHRHYRRRAARVALELWRNGDLVGRFETRNIAPEGAFVETGPNDLEPYELVTIVVRDRERRRLYQLRAMVVHRSQEGAGLLYEVEVPALYRRLVDEAA